MPALNKWFAALAAWCCVGCSPTLDWREFVAEGSDLTVTFPCRPDRYSRTVMVAGENVQMIMLTCKVSGASYAVSFIALSEPGRISSALAALRSAAVNNVQGSEPQFASLAIVGMTPNDETTRLSVAGRLPDGTAVVEQAAFFTRGMRVYQATVIGVEPELRAVEPFFVGLRFAR